MKNKIFITMSTLGTKFRIEVWKHDDSQRLAARETRSLGRAKFLFNQMKQQFSADLVETDEYKELFS